MTRICTKCGYENDDSFNFCAKCGTSLIEGVETPQFNVVMPLSGRQKRNIIILSYVITIAFAWGGLVIKLLLSHSNIGFISFFGLFLPFYMLQSSDREIKKHGYIQLVLSIVGLVVSYWAAFNL